MLIKLNFCYKKNNNKNNKRRKSKYLLYFSFNNNISQKDFRFAKEVYRCKWICYKKPDRFDTLPRAKARKVVAVTNTWGIFINEITDTKRLINWSWMNTNQEFVQWKNLGLPFEHITINRRATNICILASTLYKMPNCHILWYMMWLIVSISQLLLQR